MLGLYVSFCTPLSCVQKAQCSNFDFFMQLKNFEDHMEFEHGYDMSSPSIITVSTTNMPMLIKHIFIEL